MIRLLPLPFSSPIPVRRGAIDIPHSTYQYHAANLQKPNFIPPPAIFPPQKAPGSHSQPRVDYVGVQKQHISKAQCRSCRPQDYQRTTTKSYKARFVNLPSGQSPLEPHHTRFRCYIQTLFRKGDRTLLPPALPHPRFPLSTFFPLSENPPPPQPRHTDTNRDLLRCPS